MLTIRYADPLQRLPGESHRLHPGKTSTKAPSTVPATNIKSTRKPTKPTVRRSLFDDAAEASDHAAFTNDQPTSVPPPLKPTSRVPKAKTEAITMPPPVKPKAKTKPLAAAPSRISKMIRIVVGWGNFAKQFFSPLWRKLLGFALLAVLILLLSGDGIHQCGTAAVNALRRHTPDVIAHPLGWLNAADMTDAQKTTRETMNAEKSCQLSASEINSLVAEEVDRQLSSSSSKIEAIVLKVRDQSNQKLRQFNHFAYNMGAIPVPETTDPTYTPNYYQRVSLAGRAVRFTLKLANIKPPVPLGPEASLMPWEEAGQCWCATKKAHGVQLGIRTKERFYPTEIVIEHINQEATLDKGSRPKQMELLIKVPLDKQDEIAMASMNMFPDAEEETILDREWIRVARWTVGTDESMQVFELQVNPKRYDITADEFVVRARNNWGEPAADHTCFYRVRVHGEMPEVKGFKQFSE